MSEELPHYCQLPDEPARHLDRFGVGLLALLVLVLVLTVSYVIGEKLQNFQWSALRNGLLVFGTLTLGAVLLVVLTTAAIRVSMLLLPNQAKSFQERGQLRRAHRKAVQSVAQKERLSEERARLTARMQATFLFERESRQTANSRSAQAFRDALQNSIVRSCDIAFQHIGKVVEQYEQLIDEINESPLASHEKTQLLNELTQRLDIAAQEKSNRDAHVLMSNEIWKMRLRKARVIARDNSAAAVAYLQGLLPSARGQQLRNRMAAMIRDLSCESTVDHAG